MGRNILRVQQTELLPIGEVDGVWEITYDHHKQVLDLKIGGEEATAISTYDYVEEWFEGGEITLPQAFALLSDKPGIQEEEEIINPSNSSVSLISLVVGGFILLGFGVAIGVWIMFIVGLRP